MSENSSNRTMQKWIVVGLAGVLILTTVGFFVAAQPVSPLAWVRPERAADPLQILPAPAFAYHELQASGPALRTLRQNRDRADRPHLVWSVNGEDVEAAGAVLPSGSFRRGDVVRVRVESTGPAGPVVGAEVSAVIANAPPHIRAAYIERPAHRPHEANLRVEASDPDQDPLDYDVTWLLDGEPWSGAYGMRANISALESGQSLQCKVVVSDGESTIDYLTSPLGVDNQPPALEVAQSPSIETNADGGRMAVLAASSTDPDGDRVRIAAVGAPSGVRWDQARQALVWNVMDGVETFDVILRADDQRGGQAERTITLRR